MIGGWLVCHMQFPPDLADEYRSTITTVDSYRGHNEADSSLRKLNRGLQFSVLHITTAGTSYTAAIDSVQG